MRTFCCCFLLLNSSMAVGIADVSVSNSVEHSHATDIQQSASTASDIINIYSIPEYDPLVDMNSLINMSSIMELNDIGRLEPPEVPLTSTNFPSNLQANSTPTPTPTPTQTPVAVTTGSLSPSSPPASTSIDHSLSVEFATEVPNGTTITFPPTYEVSDFRLHSVNATQNESAKTSVRGRLTSITTTQNQTVRQPGIKLTTTGNVRDVDVDLTIQHQTVQAQTEYDISAVAPDADPVSVSQFFVRPVGSDNRAALSGEFDRAAGRGFIYPNATVYRGERDISFRGELDSPLRGTGGNNDGVLLSPPIPTDIPTGTYSINGRNDTASVQLQEPEITTLRIENTNSADVTGGTIYTGETETATVIAQSNFEDAEQLELTVRNEDGTDITKELIETAPVRPETESGRPVRSISSISHTMTTTQSIQPMRSTVTSSTVTPNKRSLSLREKPANTSQLSTEIHRDSDATVTRQTQMSNTPGPDVERTVNQSDVEPGETVAVTLKATVGSNNKLAIVDKFSPNVQQGEITNLDIGETDATPILSVIRDNGLVFRITDVPSGTRVEINYRIKTNPVSQTYALDGYVKTDGVQTESDTTEIVAGTGGAGSTVVSGGQVQWQLDVSDIDAQTVTVELTGSDDLDTNKAKSTAQLTISDASPTVSVSDSQPNRGERPTVSVSDGVYGSTYTIGINTADIKDNVSPSGQASIFRDVGTTQEIGIITEDGTIASGSKGNTPAFIYAEVKIDTDDGTGETKIETDHLDKITTLKLSARDQAASTLIKRGEIIAETDLSVGDRDVTLSGPDGYIPGDETTLRGNADSGVDTVLMYVRSTTGSQYELVDLDGTRDGSQSGLSVSGEFSKETVLSRGDAPGNRLLSLPGTYQLALQSKAILSDTRRTVPQTISRAELLTESPSLHTIEVRQPTVTLEQPGINGVVADTQDVIKINGSANGRDSALLVAIGDRGTIQTKVVEGPTFNQTELSISDFSAGRVSISVVSAGRDGRLGDGEFNQAQITGVDDQFNQLQNQLQQAAGGTTTGDQLRALLRTETDLDTASDDQLTTESVQIVPANIEINTPTQNTTIRSNSLIQVSGSTTVESYSGDISVLLTGESITQTREQSQQWDDDGWNVTLPVSNLTPGQYRIKASIEDTTAIRMIEIAAKDTPTQASSRMTNTVKSTQRDGVSPSENTAMSDQTPTQVPSSPTEESGETTAPSSQESVEDQLTNLTSQSKPSEDPNNNTSNVIALGGLAILLVATLVFVSTRQP